MPRLQLVVPAGIVDVGQHLVIQGDGAQLVVAGGEQLDQIVPVRPVSVRHKALPHRLQIGNIPSELRHGGGGEVVGGEIARLQGTGVELVHGGGGVGHGADFIGVELLPPVQRGGDVHGYEDLPDELSVVAARGAQPRGQIQIVLP